MYKEKEQNKLKIIAILNKIIQIKRFNHCSISKK